MTGINEDAEMRKIHPDPQEGEEGIYCEFCGESIPYKDYYFKIPSCGIWHKDCMEEQYLFKNV